ncbi:DNA helicase [Lactobacillus phage phiJL-1]|uniref:Helicase n=1 Tax=Lactobacillus phage phiJL-1 TaxID=2892345 RepID=Q597S9_9CAUD|nr:DNA helicase [Lactobacillus phage phiJL-1]AAP74542.1 putative helicase [Lactobacillus phage phiJL-1]
MFKLYDYQQRIVDETRNKLRQGNKGVLIVSPPGSGKSVIIGEITRLTTLKKNRVLFTVHRQELVDQITDTFDAMGVNQDYTTVMTVGRVKNRLDKLEKPDLIIVDESQHTRAKTYTDILDYYSDVPRLGFSGSPWRMNGQGFDDIYPAMVEGPSVKWLIDNYHLAPFTYYAPQTLEGFKKRNGEYDKKSVDEVLGSKIFGDAVSSYLSNANGKQAILYAHSVEYAKKYAVAFEEAGVNAASVDGKTPKAERDRIINDFRSGKLKVLCNNDLISEGFDVPNCEVVIMCRPTASLVLYLQQSMRCMRYVNGKQAMIIDHVGNYVRFGLPDDDRQWSLSGRNSNGKVDAPDIHTCQHCYQVFYEWTADNRCPYCGELKPEADPRTAEGKKQIEQAKMIEIANRKVEKSDSLISIYEHFKARKTMNIGNVHRPINAAIRQKGVCSNEELIGFADYLGVKKNYVLMLYNHKY